MTDPLILSPAAPLESAETFVERNYHNGTHRLMHAWNDDVYTFNEVAYDIYPKDDLRAQLYDFLRSAFRIGAKGQLVPFNPNTAKVNNVLDALKASTILPTLAPVPMWVKGVDGPPADELVVMQNGILHLPTLELIPVTPGLFATHCCPFAYDPDFGDPKQFLAFLESLWPDDPGAIDCLLEIIGVLVTSDIRYQKIFLLVGPKRSGKGTLAKVLTALVGAPYVCNPTLAGIGQHFGLQPLIGKRVAIISDARLGGRADLHILSERLLSISGGDNPNVPRKFRDDYEGPVSSQFIIMSNEPPRLHDASGVLASRFIALQIEESFYGREDFKLIDKLLPELPGIFNWALEGQRRVAERGTFKMPESGKKVVQQIEALSAPVGTFVEDKCEIAPDLTVKVAKLYQVYTRWCDDHGYSKASDGVFGRDLGSWMLSKGAPLTHRRLGGRRIPHYEGIALIPPPV